jgi:hypothetical protein
MLPINQIPIVHETFPPTPGLSHTRHSRVADSAGFRTPSKIRYDHPGKRTKKDVRLAELVPITD